MLNLIAALATAVGLFIPAPVHAMDKYRMELGLPLAEYSHALSHAAEEVLKNPTWGMWVAQREVDLLFPFKAARYIAIIYPRGGEWEQPAVMDFITHQGEKAYFGVATQGKTVAVVIATTEAKAINVSDD